MANVLNRKTLSDLFTVDFPDYLDQKDPKRVKGHLFYNQTTGWGLRSLLTIERLAKFLPNCFLELLGLKYLVNTKIDHLFVHRHDDLGQNREILKSVDLILKDIWVRQHKRPLEEFFVSPDIELEEIKPTVKKPIGLINGGNTCYLNSFVQALFATTSYQDLFKASPEKGILFKALKNLFLTYKDSKKSDQERLQKVLDFRKILFDSKQIKYLEDKSLTGQQDLVEILLDLLPLLQNGSIKRQKKTKVLSTPLISLKGYQGTSVVKESEAFLDKYPLKNLPRVLPILNPKGTGGFSKLAIDPQEKIKACLNDTSIEYSLKSVIKNLDYGNDCGHYISFVRQGDQWYSINDSVVKKISKGDLIKEIGTATLFFYESN